MKRFEIGMPVARLSRLIARSTCLAHSWLRNGTSTANRSLLPHRVIRSAQSQIVQLSLPAGAECSSLETKISGGPTDRMALLERRRL